MTRNIQRLSHMILLCFGLVAASLLYWQVVRAPELSARADNPRLVQAELRLRRGHLLDRRGQVLAYSEVIPDIGVASDIVERRYPYPETAHVVGYYSLRYGEGGAENAFDSVLRGQLSPFDQLLHRPQVGQDVWLSLDLAAQQAAGQALGERQGAAVLLDVATGQVLVLVSHPIHKPNTLEEDWDALAADPEAPLLNRATQGVYPLGDLARLVGLAGLLSAGITSPPDPLRTSLDAMLAPLSQPGYLATAHQLGFDTAPPFELPTGPGLLPDFTGKGTPRDLAATPLHMARFAAAIADTGLMPVPTLAYPATTTSSDRAFAPDVAAALRAATPQLDGLAGWSGIATPQETGDQPLSWFVGYAPAGAPHLAMAIVVEDSDGGSSVTLPIAQKAVRAIQD